MCDPVAIAIGSAVLTAGGGFINNRQQNAAVSKQNDLNRAATARSAAAADAERGRQRQMEEESFAKLAESLGAAEDVAKGEPQQEVKDRLQAETADAAPRLAVSSLPGQASGDTDMARMIGREINEKGARTEKQLEALATLTGLGSAFSGLGDDINENSSGIQTVNSRRRGSANVSRLESNIPPGQARPSNNPIGDLMMLGGQALGAFGGGIGGGGTQALQGAPHLGIPGTFGAAAPSASPFPAARPNLPF